MPSYLPLDDLDELSAILEKLECLVNLAFYAIGSVDERRLMVISMTIVRDYVSELRQTVSGLQEVAR